MLGRATRPCDDIGKDHFEIYDAVGVYNALEPVKEMEVYDAGIDNVIKVIGSDFESVEELKILISKNIGRIEVSIVSRYVLERLIK